MKKHNSSRRQFLIGAGGTMLALPFLPSLMPRAAAQAAVAKRIIFIASQYGQPGSIYFPANAPTTRFNNEEWVRYQLLSQVEGNISHVFQAGYNPLRSKMSLIRGLDAMGMNTHNRTAFLTGQVTGDHRPPTLPTIDVLMENSPNVFEANTPLKVLRLNGYGPSYPDFGDHTNTWSWRRNAQGGFEKVPYINNDRAAFSTVFPNGGNNTPPPSNVPSDEPFIIDKVLASYKNLMSSRKLATEDKQRVEAHVDLVTDLQKRIQAEPAAPVGGCEVPELNYFPTNNAGAQVSALYNNYFDIMIAAMACKGTRVGVVYIPHSEDRYDIPHDRSMSYHHLRSHEYNPSNPLAQQDYLRYSRFIAEQVLSLAKKLDATVDFDGKSMLENTLIVWGNELGEDAGFHRVHGQTIAAIGGFGGAVRTGYHIDYRHLTDGAPRVEKLGRPYNQFLIGLMRAMGMQPNEYMNLGDDGGFGGWRSNASSEGYDVKARMDRLYKNVRNNPAPFFFT